MAETYAGRRARENRERRESLASSRTSPALLPSSGGLPGSGGSRLSAASGGGACVGGGVGGACVGGGVGGARFRSPPTSSREEPAVQPPPLSLSRSPLSLPQPKP